MTKPDKQMPDIKQRISEYIEYAENTKRYADVGFYNDVLRCFEDRESKHLSEIAALEKKHRGDMLAMLDEVKCEIDDANWRYLHGYAGAVMPVNKIKAIINQLREQVKK